MARLFYPFARLLLNQFGIIALQWSTSSAGNGPEIIFACQREGVAANMCII